MNNSSNNRDGASLSSGEQAGSVFLNEQRLKNILSQVNSGIAQTDIHGRFIDVNDRYTAIVGFTREELLTMSMVDLTHPDDISHNLSLLKRCVESGDNFVIEKRYIHKNGSYVWVNNSVSLIVDENGNAFIIAVATDITRSKNSERALRESEERYQNFIRQSTEGIWRFEIDSPISTSLTVQEQIELFFERGFLAECNDAMARMYGYETASQLVGTRLSQFFPRDADTEAYLGYFITSDYRVEAAESKEIDREGRIRYFLNNLVGIVENGLLVRAWGTQRDITDQKNTEHQLKESEQRFRSIADNTPAFVFMGDANANVQFVNKEWLAFIGLDNLENFRQSWTSITHPDDAGRIMEVYTEAVKKRQPYKFEARQLGADKTYHWILWKGIPRTDPHGNFEGMMGVGIDITDRKLAEQAVLISKDESERQKRVYETVNNSTPDLIYVFDLAYRFTYANKALLNMWGKNAEQAIGKGLLENGYEPWHAEMHEREIDQVVATKKPIRGEVSFPHATLGKRVYDYIFAPVLSANGNVEAVAGTTRDITEIRVAEESIKESEERFRILAETLPQMVWVTNDKGNMEYYSRQWRDYSGVEFPDQAWNYMIHPEDRRPANNEFDRAIEEGRPFRYEVRLRNRNGDYRWHYSIAEPVRDGNARIIKWVGAITDIHDQKTLAEKLEKLVEERTEELIRSNEDLQQFAHVASHDLKEPVRKFKMFGGRLKNEFGDTLPEQAKLYVNKMEAAADRMYLMIEGVLLYSTLNAVQHSKETIDLNAVIRDIQTDLEIVIQQKSAVINYNDLGVMQGTQILIYQLFYNLINNSLKFSKPGVAPVITVSRQQQSPEPGFISITVDDNGIGFYNEEAENIFNPFIRLNPKDKYEGTGLGLSLCRNIVEKHGGRISANGSSGNGASFTILLPA